MIRALNHIVLLFFIFLFVKAAGAQTTWATVQTNKKVVYPGEPIRMSVIVYTSTWFTTSPKIQNLSVSNAFVVSFKRTISGIRKVNGKQYASLEYTYQVFPYASGKLDIPSFQIDFESPADGDFKGLSVSLKTEPQSITVEKIPSGWSTSYDWFTAQNVFLTDKWSSSLDTLKVGDILSRTITINAKGTLPNFIPAISLSTSDGYRVYQQKVNQVDTRTNKQANGKRTEEWLYLFEKEGVFEIPAYEIHWFNPTLKQVNLKVSKAKRIVVKPNSELNILQTRIDSLSGFEQANQKGKSEKKSWKTYLSYLQKGGVAILAIIVFYKLITWLLSSYKKLTNSLIFRKLLARQKLKRNSENGYQQLQNMCNYLEQFEAIRYSHLTELITHGEPKLQRTWKNLQSNQKVSSSSLLKLLAFFTKAAQKTSTFNLTINP